MFVNFTFTRRHTSAVFHTTRKEQTDGFTPEQSTSSSGAFFFFFSFCGEPPDILVVFTFDNHICAYLITVDLKL